MPAWLLRPSPLLVALLAACGPSRAPATSPPAAAVAPSEPVAPTATSEPVAPTPPSAPVADAVAPPPVDPPTAVGTAAPTKPPGALDKDIIRRVVRSNIADIRTCYSAGLARDPNLGGRVAVQFTVGPAGAVVASRLADTDLGDRGVIDCVVAAPMRWTFPPPEGGGNVVITYPFVLETG